MARQVGVLAVFLDHLVLRLLLRLQILLHRFGLLLLHLPVVPGGRPGIIFHLGIRGHDAAETNQHRSQENREGD